MSDIVEKLRNDQGIGINLTLCREAADEIERLRAALELAQNLDDPLLLEIERLRAENRRLVALVEDAFEEGFQEGKDGGWICGATIPWSKSYARAALLKG